MPDQVKASTSHTILENTMPTIIENDSVTTFDDEINVTVVDLNDSSEAVIQMDNAESDITDQPELIEEASSTTVVAGTSGDMALAHPQSYEELAACQPNSTKTDIWISPGQVREAMLEAELALSKSGRYFQRDGRIVEVLQQPGDGSWCVKELDDLGVFYALAGLTQWMRMDNKTSSVKYIDPHGQVCKLLSRVGSFEHLKVLNGLAFQPHLREDASICINPGYDEQTRLFGVFNADGVEVADHPTMEDARGALACLDSLIDECAFAGPEDKSTAISAMLTAAVRPGLPTAPMFHVKAHQMGTGKSFLCQLITAFASEKAGAPVAFPRNDGDCKNLLLSQFKRSPAVIDFDNLTSDIPAYASLCTALTSEWLEGRLLGGNTIARVSTRTLMLSSGNNAGPTADMARRTLTIRLDSPAEVPAARKFRRPDLMNDVLQNRNRYVSTALTIVRAWVVAGRPMTECAPLGSFGQWSEWCRQPLLWLGCLDPVASVLKALEDDPERQLLGRVLEGWHALMGNAPVLARDVVQASIRLSAEGTDLHEALIEVSGGLGSVNQRKLGRWLSRNEGRVVSGRRLQRAPKTRNVESWQVVSV